MPAPDLTDALDALWQRVTERLGDPAAAVYERLFAQEPGLKALFSGGSDAAAVRGEMFWRALETLQDLARGAPWAAGLLASERARHDMAGVDRGQFDRFYRVMGEVLRDALGDEWTADTDTLWQALVARADEA